MCPSNRSLFLQASFGAVETGLLQEPIASRVGLSDEANGKNGVGRQCLKIKKQENWFD